FGIVHPVGSPSGAEDESVFFDRSRDGWFWYLELKMPRQMKGPVLKRLPPTLKEMRARAEELLNRAIEAPTQESVAVYMAYQRLLTQRAEEFARIWQSVLWQHPELDPTVEDPIATVGLSLAQAEKARKRDEALSHLAQTSGLLYFFSGNCPLCEVQSPILSVFAQVYGFSVVPISLDGAADPVLGPGKADRGAAGKLGVEKVPTIFLAQPPSEIIRVGTGLLAMEDLAERLYHLSEALKEKRDEDQNERNPITDNRDFMQPAVEPPSLGRFAAAAQ
ncbi:MAG: conjugal transfer protein TraF, partial [Nitrospiria bacterium]